MFAGRLTVERPLINYAKCDGDIINEGEYKRHLIQTVMHILDSIHKL